MPRLAVRSLSFIISTPIRPAQRQNFLLDSRRHLARKRSPFAVLSAEPKTPSDEEKPLPPLAPVGLKNSQRKYEIDLQEVQRDVDVLRSILHIRDFQVDIWFCSSSKIRELNEEHRNKTKATDVLSFPMIDFQKPEKLPKKLKEFDKHLGDIVICPAYVDQQCQYDKADVDKGLDPALDDRGVSKVMATQFRMQDRIAPLLIHSLLHLLGHDHEEDEEYALMVKREEEVLEQYYTAKRDSSAALS